MKALRLGNGVGICLSSVLCRKIGLPVGAELVVDEAVHGRIVITWTDPFPSFDPQQEKL